MKIIFVLILLVSSSIYAETITFKTQPIQKSKNPFTGDIPYIQAKGFNQINQQIKNELLIDDSTSIEFESAKIYQDHDYLSIRVNQEISGGRTYYRSRYFVIDLKSKKLMTLDQILKRYQLSATDISRQIGEGLEPCIVQNTPIREECNSAAMEYVYRDYAKDRHVIDLINAKGFYLKKNILGVTFDAGPYSVPFEYSVKMD